MKKNLIKSLVALLLLLLPGLSFGQVITLGNTSKFVLFTSNGSMTNSGTLFLTHLTGNVGSNLPGAISGFGNVDGVMHDFDVVSAACTADLTALYGQLNGAIPTVVLASPFGNGNTVVAGVYKLLSAATLNGDLILNAQGDPNAVFIFQIQGALSTNVSSKIKLINGALACNVYWKVEGSVNMATKTSMKGTIVAHNDFINMSVLDTLEGRALSINGAVSVTQLVAYTPLGCGSPVLTGPAAPALDSAGTYGVFSGLGSVTSTPVTYVTGNVGSNSTTSTGFNPLNVTGLIHTPPDASTAQCASDLTNVYNYLVAMPADIDLLDPADFGHDLVLTPHAYQVTGITALTGDVYLNAQGNPNAVFVIKINGTFTTSTSSRVILQNGAQAKNVYWKIDGAVNIFSNSLFNGTIVAAGAITLNTGDTLNGRALTINGAVAINGSYIAISPLSCTAPPIVGLRSLCKGDTTTLTDITAGGKWTSVDSSIAAVDSTTGKVRAKTAGITMIVYTTAAGCSATDTMTVNAIPSIIGGPGFVCVGTTVTLTDSVAGGTWTSSNIANATIGSASGIATGVAQGTPTITYTIANGCKATRALTVNPLPNAGAISGPSVVCIGSVITLTDAASGGVWSASNTTATVAGGIVTGITTGVDTISYTVTNACGTAAATKTVSVSVPPNAGTITGPASVCIGSSVTFTDAIPGGVWSASNTTATVVAGIVTGVTAGVDNISYTVTSTCGSATAVKTITVDPVPNAGTIAGLSAVCAGSSVTFIDPSAGGIWSASNTTATVVAGIVTGVTTGVDTISYTVTNACGSATAVKTITVNATPEVSVPAGQSVCNGSATAPVNFSGSVGGTAFDWTNNNTGIGLAASGTGNIASFIAANTANTPATATITVTPSANGCTGSSRTTTIVVNPTPVIAATANMTVCNGATTTPVTFTANVAGTTYNWTNTNTSIGLTAANTGNIPSFTAVNNTNAPVVATISVTPVANGCAGLQKTFTITVNINPATPVITISAPAAVCDSTYFVNFGAVSLPPAGMKYSWSAVNAMISDSGTTGQYALVNFKTPGHATVIVTSTIFTTGCSTGSTAFDVNVSANSADHSAKVIYFNHSFVCLQNNESAYQWGYDDSATLAPTVIAGAINQDYDNATPDLIHNRYWVMVTNNGCTQKAYYNKPENAAMRPGTTEVSVYPNPAANNLQLTVNTTVTGDIEMQVMNILGRKMYTMQAIGSSTQVDVSDYAPGVYMVICYRNGEKISTVRFVKN